MTPTMLERNNSHGRSFCGSNGRGRRNSPSSSSFSLPSQHSNYYAITMINRSSSISSSSRPSFVSQNHDRDFHVINSPSRTGSCSFSGDQQLVVVNMNGDNNNNHFTMSNTYLQVSSFVRTILRVLSLPYAVLSPPTCQWLASSVLGTVLSRGRSRQLLPVGSDAVVTVDHHRGNNGLRRKVTGTLFGHRRGHVTFAVQDGPGSEPALLLDLAMSTATLVKEMSSGLVRIVLECDKSKSSATTTTTKLFDEAAWSMYCNGRKCGYAASRRCCNWLDSTVLNTVRSVSVGAGVIPAATCALEGGEGEDTAPAGEGELLYMRAKFQRVVGSRDSEAFYMMNPDGSRGPELSLFLLRL